MARLLFKLRNVLCSHRSTFTRLSSRSRPSRDDIRVNVMRCEHRTFLNSDDYWLGLDIQSSTAWYDGNPSIYRNWIGGEPNDTDRCVAYTTNGFDDKACNEQHYYTCKKHIGNLSAFVTHSTVFIYSCNTTHGPYRPLICICICMLYFVLCNFALYSLMPIGVAHRCLYACQIWNF